MDYSVFPLYRQLKAYKLLQLQFQQKQTVNQTAEQCTWYEDTRIAIWRVQCGKPARGIWKEQLSAVL